MNALVAGFRGIAEYFSGVLGADAYKKYLEHHRASGHNGAPMSERDFGRDPTDRPDRKPHGRCG